MEAFTDFLFGLSFAQHVYLGRDVDNYQFYRNDKDLGDTSGDGDGNTTRDVIDLDIQSRGIGNVTFRGTGEGRENRVDRGTIEMSWDVWRSSNGTVDRFWSSGFDFFGDPILSRTVITGQNGRFELFVSAPLAAFGKSSFLDATGRPIILICELPNGKRFALSSLLSSVNGPPILFNAVNQDQKGDGTAPSATTFNFNLDNVGTTWAFEGWDGIPFNRNSGFAESSGNRPLRPAGLNDSDIQVGTQLPMTHALDQFVFWEDFNGDGMWTASDDSDFSDIRISAACIDHMAFTMTSFGVQFGEGINNLVGGYGFLFFNNESSPIGIFQFGPPRSGNAFFAAGNDFPNSSSTQGWGFLTSPATFDPITGITASNPLMDFCLRFDNNNGTFTVESIDLANPTGTNNINNASSINAGDAAFYHFRRN